MLATTALIALGKKIQADKARKKEAKQGHLLIGDSRIARDAFNSQTKTLETGGVRRAATDIKWEEPGSVVPTQETSCAATPDPYTASPVKSEKASITLRPTDTEYSETTRSSTSEHPPPYSPRTDSVHESHESALSPTALKSPTSDTASLFSTHSSIDDPNAIRVRTNGTDLKSGFPYHPTLFDVRVRPDDWERFTHQVVESTKFTKGDHAQMWAAATSVALTGAIGTSVWVGRSMNRSLQEKKVKAGLQNNAAGSLGDTLQQWNSDYFHRLGLFAHLEVSDAARQKEEQQGRSTRKGSLLNREDRARRREDKKFVIVVSRIEASVPAQKQHGVLELPAGDDGVTGASPAFELPVNEAVMPVELPADMAYDQGKSGLQLPSNCFELPAELPASIQRVALEEKTVDDGSEEHDETLRPAPLSLSRDFVP